MQGSGDVDAFVAAGRDLAPDVGSSVAGVLVGTAIAGPGGTIVGAAAAPVLRRGLGALAQRFFGQRAQARIGAAALYACDEIRSQLEAGGSLRDDGFFDGDPSDAEEILEGVLLAAQDSFEERKVRYLGYLYATVACTDQISPYLANRLLAQARQLTYRQLVLLAMISDRTGRQALPGKIDLPEDKQLTLETIGYLQDLHSLYQQSLIGYDPPRAPTGPTGHDAQAMQLDAFGSILVSAMKLDRIPPEERVVRTFRGVTIG